MTRPRFRALALVVAPCVVAAGIAVAARRESDGGPPLAVGAGGPRTTPSVEPSATEMPPSTSASATSASATAARRAPRRGVTATETTLTIPPVVPTTIRPDPAQERIDREGVYVMRRDGSGLRRVGIRGSLPSWAPDGSRFAYQCGYPTSRICVAHADGRDPLTLTPSYAGDPAWAPDGASILFLNANGEARLMTIEPRADAQAVPFWPDIPPGLRGWSGDGRLGVTSSEPGSSKLTVHHRNGSRTVAAEPAGGELGVDWSPNGKLIPYTINHDLYVARADGSGTEKVRADACVGQSWAHQRWFPDSRRFLVMRCLGNDVELSIAGTDGSATTLVKGPGYLSGAVSPDGRTVALVHFERDGALHAWVEFVDTLTHARKSMAMPETPFAVTEAQWSPDGEWLAMSVWDGRGDPNDPRSKL